MEAFGPFVLTERLTAEGVLQERFRARRVTSGDVSGPQLVTRREGSPDDLAALVRSWCESAARRDAAAHPGVTRCLEVGAAQGYVYEASELADGETLGALLEAYAFAGEHPPLDVALVAGRALAALLMELHGRGIVVGYLVPENLILTWDGRLVLDRIGVPDETVRRAPWTAPELQRKSGADARTDAWVLGRVLRGILSGHGGSRPRVPARHAGAVRDVLKGLLAVSRKKRTTLPAGAAELDEQLLAIGAEAGPALLAAVMAAKLSARAKRTDEKLDLGALKSVARGITDPARFYPPGAGGSPLPSVPARFERDETKSDTYRRDDGSITEASIPALSDDDERRSDSGSGSDEGGPLELDLVSDPAQPVRTEVTEVPPYLMRPGQPGALVASDSDEGSLPWAEALSASREAATSSVEGAQGSAEGDLDLHMDAQLPLHVAFAHANLPGAAAAADASPFSPTATVVSEGLSVGDVTRPDTGPTAEPSDAAAAAFAVPKAPVPLPPDARTRTGTGHQMDYQEAPSVDDVWADSGRNRAARGAEARNPGATPSGGRRPGGKRPEARRPDATEVLELPEARILPSKGGQRPVGSGEDGDVFAGAAEPSSDATVMIEPDEPAPRTVAARLRTTPSSRPGGRERAGIVASDSSVGDEMSPAMLDPYGGVLVVDAPEGATVYVDGARRGRGPLKLEGMPREGLVEVRVYLSGYRPWTAEVSLDGKPAARVTPNLLRR